MSTSKKSGYVDRHRAEDLPLRRWLQLGAASAGIGAALIGWSLVGSEVGVASAHRGVESSSSAGPAASPSKGVDSGSAAPSPSGRAGTAASRDDADAPSTTSRKVNRTVAADAADAPSQVVSRSNRVAAAETSSVADRLTNSTNVNSRVASRAATPNSNPFSAAQNAFTPPVATAQPSAAPRGSLRPNADVPAAMQSAGHQPATPAAATNGELAQILQNPGTQLLGAGGAGPLPVVMAGKSDGLGALGRVLADAFKKALDSKTLLNPVQRLDDLTPRHRGLFDLIPKIPVPKNHSTWNREGQAREAETRRRADARTRQIDEILQKGVKLNARDGMAVYTIDGKTFVTYFRPLRDGPLEPTLVRLENFEKNFEKNMDRIIRRDLKLDPAFVRSLWGKPLPLRGQDPGGGAS
jgi:hypothetical protein